MKIKTVTITGADNNTDINEMLEISNQYPFVEWGILFSPKRIGEERYPDMSWVFELCKTFIVNPTIQLSAHLCGGYTREMLTGKDDLIRNNLEKYLGAFSRRQLNFNSSKDAVNLQGFFQLLEEQSEGHFILQQNNANFTICHDVRNRNIKNIDFLYDSSGGRGTVASQWKKPFDGFFTGYAGGLSPDNLEYELKKIQEVCGDAEIWIDTESHVRTNCVLDMNKVKQFLGIASKYVSQLKQKKKLKKEFQSLKKKRVH